jgi:hypothetical protein
MSWSLQLSHGDFTVSQAQFGTVTNESKLVQDLRCALLQKMGSDLLHTDFGSVIDGGIGPDGSYVEGVVGENDIDMAVLFIESEIQRVVRAHQARQLARAKADRSTYGRATLGPREVVIGLANIAIIQDQDILNVAVTLQVGSGEMIDINVPLTATGSQLDLNNTDS